MGLLSAPPVRRPPDRRSGAGQAAPVFRGRAYQARTSRSGLRPGIRAPRLALEPARNGTRPGHVRGGWKQRERGAYGLGDADVTAGDADGRADAAGDVAGDAADGAAEAGADAAGLADGSTTGDGVDDELQPITAIAVAAARTAALIEGRM